jgi:hypothetical protein
MQLRVPGFNQYCLFLTARYGRLEGHGSRTSQGNPPYRLGIGLGIVGQRLVVLSKQTSVCFSQLQTFVQAKINKIERQLTATSGR